MIHGSDPTIPMPAPPWSTGRARKAGSQKNRPQLANWTAEPSAMMRSVRLRKTGPKMTAKGLGPPAACAFCFQVSGSLT